MADRTIAQRELRNDVGAVLRAAQAGETFTVTVRGRPVARVVPLDEPVGPRIDVPASELRRMLEETPVDRGWLDELLEMREEQRAVPADPYDR